MTFNPRRSDNEVKRHPFVWGSPPPNPVKRELLFLRWIRGSADAKVRER